MSEAAGTILVADDEASLRWVLGTALREDGHTVEEADGGEAALARLLDRDIDVALVDIRMHDLDGLTVLSRAREAGVRTPVIIITAQNTMANAIEAMKRGAYDYVTKPFDLEEVQLLVRRALETHRQTRQLARLEGEARRRFELGVEIVGTSPAMQAIFKTIGRVAHTDATVLLQGESGTGKELIARTIHSHSQRWSGPFVAVNCSAIPRDLLESELFGHERGAFTGAVEQRPGVFETAAGGTLFLDEIGDMPLELQAKLLRVLQEREFSRVGGRAAIRLDCRIIAATHRDLELAIRQGQFREDLYFRLKVVPITVPPLRQRREDIPHLIRHFLARVRRDMPTRVEGIAPEAVAALVQHDWPGNVRELENVIIRAALLAPGPTLMARDLPLGSTAAAPAPPEAVTFEEVLRARLRDELRQLGDGMRGDLYASVISRVERPLIELVLEHTRGNQLRAAALLGINRNTLHKKIIQLKIPAKGRVSDDG